MSTQVERLEELLARVERNRQKPRKPQIAAISSTSIGKEMSPKAAPQEVDTFEPAAPDEPSARFATAAVQSQKTIISTPAVVEKRPEAMARPAPAPKIEPQPVAVKPAAVAPQPARAAEGVEEIAAAQVVRPAEAIGKVIGKPIKVEEATFGQLLQRTLSLRPS